MDNEFREYEVAFDEWNTTLMIEKKAYELEKAKVDKLVTALNERFGDGLPVEGYFDWLWLQELKKEIGIDV